MYEPPETVPENTPAAPAAETMNAPWPLAMATGVGDDVAESSFRVALTPEKAISVIVEEVAGVVAFAVTVDGPERLLTLLLQDAVDLIFTHSPIRDRAIEVLSEGARLHV